MDYATVAEFIRDNRELIALGVSVLSSVGVWRVGYNSFRVARWGYCKVGSTLTARREAQEAREAQRLGYLVHAALQRELDARTAPVEAPHVSISRFDGQEIDRTCLGR